MTNTKYGTLLVKPMNRASSRLLIPFKSRLPESIEDKNNKGQDLQVQLLDCLRLPASNGSSSKTTNIMEFPTLKAIFPCTLPLNLESSPAYVHRLTEDAEIAFKGCSQEQTWKRQPVPWLLVAGTAWGGASGRAAPCQSCSWRGAGKGQWDHRVSHQSRAGAATLRTSQHQLRCNGSKWDTAKKPQQGCPLLSRGHL